MISSMALPIKIALKYEQYGHPQRIHGMVWAVNGLSVGDF